jgi:hypothetical protein
MELVRLIQMCLNETYSKVRICKQGQLYFFTRPDTACVKIKKGYDILIVKKKKIQILQFLLPYQKLRIMKLITFTVTSERTAVTFTRTDNRCRFSFVMKYCVIVTGP